MDQIEFRGRGFRGGFFSAFYVAKHPQSGPGWYVHGRNPAYGGGYVMVCARPDVPARAHPHYNVKVRRGFRTMREARWVASVLNAKDADCRGMFADLPLHGTTFKE